MDTVLHTARVPALLYGVSFRIFSPGGLLFGMRCGQSIQSHPVFDVLLHSFLVVARRQFFYKPLTSLELMRSISIVSYLTLSDVARKNVEISSIFSYASLSRICEATYIYNKYILCYNFCLLLVESRRIFR